MKAAVENLEQAAVQQQCRSLRLPAVADQCAPLADVAAKQRQTYLRYLEALLAAELEEREHNTITRLVAADLTRKPIHISSRSTRAMTQYLFSSLNHLPAIFGTAHFDCLAFN